MSSLGTRALEHEMHTLRRPIKRPGMMIVCYVQQFGTFEGPKTYTKLEVHGNGPKQITACLVRTSYLTLIWNTKYRLITKLIAQVETNLRDKSIKPN
jgi:hypothetical protein